MATERRIQRQLFVLLLSIFVGTIGVGILNPLVPQLFTGKLALFPNFGYSVYGLLVATYPLAQFCSTFVLAAISDRAGRKRILLISLWGTALGYALFILGIVTKDLALLFVARAIDGATGGNIGITQAAVADLTSRANRTAKISLVGGAFGLGLIVGPVLGGTLASIFSLTAPFFVAGTIACINAVLVWTLLPKLPAASAQTTLLIHELGSKLKEYASNRRLRNLFTASFLYNCAMTGFNAFFAVYLVVRFHFSAELVGYFYTYIGIVYAFNQFVIVPRISKRWLPTTVLSWSTLFLSGALAFYALNFSLPLLVLIAPVLTILNGLCQTNIAGAVSTAGNSDEQGKLLGLNSSLFALAQTIIPPLIGLGAENLNAGLPMALGCAWMVLCALLVISARPRTKLATVLEQPIL